MACDKFKLYANSTIEYIGFGTDQMQSFQLQQVDEEMQLQIGEPAIGRWALPSGGGPESHE